jgi:hypothetical protein
VSGFGHAGAARVPKRRRDWPVDIRPSKAACRSPAQIKPTQRAQIVGKSNVMKRLSNALPLLVRRCDEHINAEFRQFLLQCGCPAGTVSQAGY